MKLFEMSGLPIHSYNRPPNVLCFDTKKKGKYLRRHKDVRHSSGQQLPCGDASRLLPETQHGVE